MEIAVVSLVIVVAVVLLAMSPMTRRTGDAVAARDRRDVDVGRDFERPRNEGDLL
jgi:hypothetical protein